MHCTKKLTNDIIWLGASDRRLAKFENAFPIPNGIAYNSYLINDEKTVLLDTVDKAVSGRFFENLEFTLAGRTLDYAIVNHMEPDHCATLGELVLRYPEVRLVVNAKTLTMIKQFFDFDVESRSLIVCEGETLSTGKHTLTFYMAPMVHWPEVMVTYDEYEKVLFSADAFGTFGALGGNIFADEMDFEADWLDEARRYYSNIVGKYGAQVQALLNKVCPLDIGMICPLHGPVWRKNLGWYVDKYRKWAAWEPEEKGVMIPYASIYGNTMNAAEILAMKLSDRGVRGIRMYDVSSAHPSHIVSDSFRFSHIVFASSTYNGGIFSSMETLLLALKAHALQNRTVAFIENGTWAAQSGKQMREIVAGMKNMTVVEPMLSIKSSLKTAQEPQLEALADALCATL
ncbi:MAG: FprA family A-type flavoprotein [Oscillospiraceae bacterium]|nr:FprA family A-type flavoprotein [Oscillospiraceae bacterium]